MADVYNTKTKKRRALKAIQLKAFNLLGVMQISTAEYNTIVKIVEKHLRQLK